MGTAPGRSCRTPAGLRRRACRELLASDDVDEEAREQLRRVSRRRFRATRDGSTGHEPLAGSEVKHELSGDGFDHFALVTEGNALPGGEGTSLKQWIFHPRNLLQHGFKRLPDDRGPHLAGAQVADFFDLQELKKRIGLGSRHQPSLLPGCQLARRDPQNAKQIRLSVSIHDGY